MTEHTPGPWLLEPRNGGDKEIIVRQDADGWHRLHCAVDCDDCDIETAIANARLIAAAPELLLACEALLERYRIMVAADGPECLQAIAAILKATGEPK